MTAITWDRLSQVCAEVVALPAAEREAALERLAAGSPELAREVRSLIAADRPAEFDRLGSPVIEVVSGLSPADRSPSPRLERIGRYRIESVLGHGGSATVHRARTLVPPRAVALKVLHAPIGHGDEDLVASRRFDAEVRALARLRHPGIAAIHDAGITLIDGAERRWIVMDLVEGGPITEWVAAELPPRDVRLGLAADLAAAVAHAHARGIIHRDLKPANVLVEMRDERPVTRVLDFGVARLLEDDEAATRVTRGGLVVGTVGYLAPEQLSGDPENLSTSVDVYAIGLILQELLTSAPAVTVPSGPLFTQLQAAARARPRPIRELLPDIDEDLAVIVETALARDPKDRYASAAALEQDLRRRIAGQPIVARPLSNLAIARRFVRRHRVATAITAVGAVALGGLLVVTASSLAREREGTDRLIAALAGSLDVANAMADTMDRQFGADVFLEEYYRRQLEFVRTITPAVAAGATLADPSIVDVVERLGPPGWRVADRPGGRRIRHAGPSARGDAAPRDPDLRSRYADAVLRFSGILTADGENLESLELRLIGLALKREALDRDPDDAERRREHAFAMVLVGDTCHHLGERAAALELYEQALRIDRELAAERPEIVRHRDDVAWGLDRIANLIEADDPVRARRLHQERLGLCDALLEEIEADGGYGTSGWGHALHGRAVSCVWLGNLADRLGDDDPDPWYAAAADHFVTLSLVLPGDVAYAWQSYQCLSRIAGRHLAAGAIPEAIRAARRAAEHCADLARRDPERTRCREAAARTSLQLARALSAGGHWRDAAAALADAESWAMLPTNREARPLLRAEILGVLLEDIVALSPAIEDEPDARDLVRHLHDELTVMMAGIADDRPRDARETLVVDRGRASLAAARRQLLDVDIASE
jgi:serine/threonine protein kinase/tetratricopeptide (TPR) repeat protein